jgi:uncharacterized protein YndB with AHSA1/START domain
MKPPALAVVLWVALSGPALAEVLETSPNSFKVESGIVVQATPDAAFSTLTRRIGEWWDSAHTWSGDARNLSLEPRAGGCFCEQLPASGGSVQHGQVIFSQPGTLLRLDASLGPFQEMAVKGVLTFRFAAEGTATRVTVNYRVSGAFTLDPAKLAPMADKMLAAQMQRLQALLAGQSAK